MALENTSSYVLESGKTTFYFILLFTVYAFAVSISLIKETEVKHF